MNDPFVLLVGVMLLARAGLRRNVPMAAFYVACAAWAIRLLWTTFSGSLNWVFAIVGLTDNYGPPPSGLSLLDLTVSTICNLALIVAVLAAARNTPIEPAAQG